MSLNFKKGIIDYIHKDSKNGTIIYPRTLASAVYDKNGEPISNKLNTGMYKESDVKDNIVTFNSDDMVDKSYVEEKDPVSGENIPVLDEYYLNDDNKKWHIMHPLYIKDKLSVCFEKITTLFHNVRYLYEMLGTTDISSIDNGTVTGALSHLNTEASTLKKSVADGKKKIADALSGQGQSTAVDASFTTLADNVTTAGNGRYNSGYARGVSDADGRVNGNSVNYQSGYNAGVTAADGRANPYSYNYQVGTTSGLNQAVYGLYNNTGYAGCWIAVYYWNPEDGKIIEPSADAPGLSSIPIHAPGNVPSFSAGGNWAIMIYDKTVSWTDRKVSIKGGDALAMIDDEGYGSTTYTKPTEATVTTSKKERKIRVFIGHGDINKAISCLESSYLKALRVF